MFHTPIALWDRGAIRSPDGRKSSVEKERLGARRRCGGRRGGGRHRAGTAARTATDVRRATDRQPQSDQRWVLRVGHLQRRAHRRRQARPPGGAVADGARPGLRLRRGDRTEHRHHRSAGAQHPEPGRQDPRRGAVLRLRRDHARPRKLPRRRRGGRRQALRPAGDRTGRRHPRDPRGFPRVQGQRGRQRRARRGHGPSARPRLRHRRTDPCRAQAHRHAAGRPRGAGGARWAEPEHEPGGPSVRPRDDLTAGDAAVRGLGRGEQQRRGRPLPDHADARPDRRPRRRRAAGHPDHVAQLPRGLGTGRQRGTELRVPGPRTEQRDVQRG